MGWRLSERADGRPDLSIATGGVVRTPTGSATQCTEARRAVRGRGVVAESYEAGFTHPENPDALRVKHVALEQLLAASGQENFSEAQWLEQEIKRAATDEEAR